MTTIQATIAARRAAPLADANRRAPNRVFVLIASAAAFCYVASVYVFVTLEGLSRVSIASAVLLLATTVVAGLSVGKLRIPWLLLFPWMFWGFNLLSMLWAHDDTQTVEPVMQAFSAILGGTALWLALENVISWKAVAWAGVAGALLLIVSAHGEVMEEGVAGRAAGLTGNANTLALSLFFAAFFVWSSPVRMPVWLNWLVLGVAAYAVLFTGSRKCLLMLAAATVLAIIRFVPPKWRDRKVWAAVALAVLALLPMLSSANPAVSEAMGVLSENQTFARTEQSFNRGRPEIRQELAEKAMAIWSTSPVIGHGAGQYGVLSGYEVYSHNNYTEILANFGLVGFALYYGMHVCIMARAIPGAIRGQLRQQAAIVLLCLILALDMAQVSFLTKLPWIFLATVSWLATTRVPGPSAAPAGDPARVPPPRYVAASQRQKRWMAPNNLSRNSPS